MNRQRRRRPQNRRPNSAVVTRAQLRRENHLIENGSKLRPLPHPTDFETVPWFPLTVQAVNVSSLNFTASSVTGNISIFAALRTQLGLGTTPPLAVRLQSIRVWGPLVAMNASTTLQPLRCVSYTLTETPSLGSSSSPTVLEDIISYPDQVSRAALGYVYPKAQQALSIFQTGSPDTPFVRITSGFGAGNVVYIRLLWRPIPPFALQFSLEDLSIS